MPRPRRREQALDDALNILSALADGAAVAADAASVPALKPVVATLLIVIKRDVRANKDAEAAFLEKANTLCEIVTKIINEANAAQGGGSSVLQERLDRLSQALNEIQNTAGALKGGRGFCGWTKRFIFMEGNKDTLAKMNEQLTNAVIMFSVGTQGATENAVRRVEHMAINAEERKAIDDIPHVDAGYLSVKEIKSGFMQGTRNDTFGTIKTWTSPEESAKIEEPIFLLTAGAGLGKSAVAHQLCVRLDDPQQWGLNLGASFFFSRGGVDSAHSFFSTLAYQLALSQDSSRPAILNAARVFLAGGREQPVRRTFEELLLKPLAALVNGAVYQPTTFIVIDGLDECKDTDLVPELLRCLLELVRKVSWIRIFLATRPEPFILPVITSESDADTVCHRRFSDPQIISESKESVQDYLSQTIPKIHRYGGFIRSNPNQFKRLVERANGLFIYARVAIKYLEMLNTRPEEHFALLLSSSGINLHPLDELYLLVLRSAFPPRDLQGSPDMQKHLHAFLTFIALCWTTLPPTAISLLLTLTDDNVLWMASRLRAVLLADENGHLVPLHATFVEFLVDSKRCIDPLYHVDTQKGHALLLRKCLASFNVDAVTLCLRSRSESPIDSQAPIDPQAMSFWCFYIINWHQHLQAPVYGDELQQDLHTILQTQPVMTRLFKGLRFGIRAITNYVQDPEEATTVCSEYINSRFYCELWWRKMNRDYTASRAASVDIAKLKSKWTFYVKEHSLEETAHAQFSIKSEDITRYTTVLQHLVDKIRDADAGELWYNLDIWNRSSPPM